MTTASSQSKALTGQLRVVGGDVEQEVLKRYRAGAESKQASLCCPTAYDAAVIKLLPAEIVEKDYGCGDPSKYVRPGETVLDLGSGAGKACYILSQKVGPAGQVIGVDFNDAMLALARKYQAEMAEKIGYANVKFRKGKIQDLALPLEIAQKWLLDHPIQTVEQLAEYESFCDQLRRDNPLIPSDSIDLIVSNCVLNLVRPQDKQQLFREMYRVLKNGGRCVISDIVCDEPPTEKIMNDPELWSGCIAGAFQEEEFLQMFADIGFYGMEILERQAEPWQTIDGIEFRSMTVRAFKGKEGPCLERSQAVMYKGPWRCVKDDDNHTLCRGELTAVCDKTYSILTNPNGPYAGDIVGIEPLDPIPLEEAKEFACRSHRLRHPRELKGMDYQVTQTPADDNCCGPDCC